MTDSPIPETWQLFDQVHLPYRILLLAKLLDRATARQLREQDDLTLAEWRVLAHLETLGEASSARIATAAAADRAEVSRAVASLERAGLIVRRPDSGNRKRLLLRPGLLNGHPGEGTSPGDPVEHVPHRRAGVE